tara:strand:- start:453 stop:719 length:267 start_codon:yes stop_codon:yes gene_type:complete
MGWEKKYLEFECMHVEKETEKALQVVINNQTLWVPKSQIAEDSEVSSEGQSGVIKLSEWIAGEKGLLEPGTMELPEKEAKKPSDEIPF